MSMTDRHYLIILTVKDQHSSRRLPQALFVVVEIFNHDQVGYRTYLVCCYLAYRCDWRLKDQATNFSVGGGYMRCCSRTNRPTVYNNVFMAEAELSADEVIHSHGILFDDLWCRFPSAIG
jgi:hypothetical protein